LVSSAYLRLLIFLLAILIPACASSSPAFHTMYSAYKLNKQGDNIQHLMYSFSNLEPVCCSMSGSNCCFLTYIQISQEKGKVVLCFHLFKNFPQFVLIHTVKGISIVNEAEADVFLEFLAVQGTLRNLLQHHSSKASILQCSDFFMVQLLHPYTTTGKTIALTRRTFVGKVMSLLFNMLSRLVITFLPRSKCLLTSWLQSPSV